MKPTCATRSGTPPRRSSKRSLRGLGRGGREGAGESEGDSRVPRELIAQALYGAYEHAALRAPPLGPRTRKDLLKAFLWLFLAAQAAGGTNST